MCGFAGELRRDGPPDRAALERMQAVLAPRGPDGQGLWIEGPVGLAHRRLAIIDLSARGAQPMVDDALGLAVVFNGCIYNHRELRAELERAGHAFASDADTEVLLKGWAEWGEGLLERLAGMFAFALAERDSGRLVLARDRLGVKPLYWCDGPHGALRFASTLPALVAGGGVDTAVDPVALHHYLSLHSIVPAPRTILRGVRKLAARHGAGRRAGRPAARAALVGPAVHARPGPRGLDRGRLGGRAARRAAHRRRAADGGRRARRRAALGRARLVA